MGKRLVRRDEVLSSKRRKLDLAEVVFLAGLPALCRIFRPLWQQKIRPLGKKASWTLSSSFEGLWNDWEQLSVSGEVNKSCNTITESYFFVWKERKRQKKTFFGTIKKKIWQKINLETILAEHFIVVAPCAIWLKFQLFLAKLYFCSPLFLGQVTRAPPPPRKRIGSLCTFWQFFMIYRRHACTKWGCGDQ